MTHYHPSETFRQLVKGRTVQFRGLFVMSFPANGAPPSDRSHVCTRFNELKFYFCFRSIIHLDVHQMSGSFSSSSGGEGYGGWRMD